MPRQNAICKGYANGFCPRISCIQDRPWCGRTSNQWCAASHSVFTQPEMRTTSRWFGCLTGCRMNKIFAVFLPTRSRYSTPARSTGCHQGQKRRLWLVRSNCDNSFGKNRGYDGVGTIWNDDFSVLNEEDVSDMAEVYAELLAEAPNCPMEAEPIELLQRLNPG